MTESEDVRILRAIESQVVAVKQFDGSDLHGYFVGLLNALADSYKLDLVEVDTAGLIRVQSALKQVVAIRDAITGAGPAVPRI